MATEKKNYPRWEQILIQRNKTRNLVLVISLLAIIGAGVYLLPQAPKAAPDISLNVIDGSKIDVKSLQGNPLLVTFWATSCSTCVQEMPHLIELYKELNQQGLEIIGIAMAYDPPNRVVELSETRKIPYPIALDITGNAAVAFGDIQATPTSFLIDPQGNIIERHTGMLNFEQLRSKLKSLLQQNNSV